MNKDEPDKFEYWFAFTFFAIFVAGLMNAISKNHALASAGYGALCMGYFLRTLQEAKRFDRSGGKNGG